MLPQLPPWVVLHVPHAVTTIPDDVRPQFVLDGAALDAELERLTDLHVMALFADGERHARWVCADVSRLVVDVERFADDARETAARHGFGAIYTRTTNGGDLRRPLTDGERGALLARHARHHERLQREVEATLREHGRCLLLDAHTFPDRRLPFETGDPNAPRPDICIGTDAVHTPPALRDALVDHFAAAGWSVAIDDPFAGTMVPAGLHGREPRLAAVMVEVNRRIVGRAPTPPLVARFRDCIRRAIEKWEALPSMA
jgi:N-formylglutamate deformylase